MWSRLLDAAQGNADPAGNPGQRGLARLRQARGVLREEGPAKESGGIPLRELDSFHSEMSSELSLGVTSATASAAAAFLRPLSKRQSAKSSSTDSAPENDIVNIKRENLQLQRQLIVVSAEAEATQKVVDILVDQGDQLRLEREAERCVSRASINAAAELENEYRTIAETFAAGLLVSRAVHFASTDLRRESTESLVQQMNNKEEQSTKEINEAHQERDLANQELRESSAALQESRAFGEVESDARKKADQLANERLTELNFVKERAKTAFAEAGNANRVAARASAAAAKSAEDAKARGKEAEKSLSRMREALEMAVERADVEARKTQAAIAAAEDTKRSAEETERKLAELLEKEKLAKANAAQKFSRQNSRQGRPEYDDESEDMVDTFVEEDAASVATDATGLDRTMSRGFSRGFSEVNQMVDSFIEDEPMLNQRLDSCVADGELRGCRRLTTAENSERHQRSDDEGALAYQFSVADGEYDEPICGRGVDRGPLLDESFSAADCEDEEPSSARAIAMGPILDEKFSKVDGEYDEPPDCEDEEPSSARAITTGPILEEKFSSVDGEYDEPECAAGREQKATLPDSYDEEPLAGTLNRNRSKFSPVEGEEIKQVWISPRANGNEEEDEEYWG